MDLQNVTLSKQGIKTTTDAASIHPFSQFDKTAKKNSIPATETQKVFWCSQQGAKPPYIHNIQVRVHVVGKVNLPLLSYSLNKLVDECECLRSVLRLNDQGELLWITQAPFEVDIPLIRLSVTDSVNPLCSTDFERLALKQAQEEYQLERGPLFRMCVLQSPDNKQVILFSFHQIILEHTSWGALLQKLLDIYAASTCDTSLPLIPPLRLSTVDYCDYECWKEAKGFNTDAKFACKVVPINWALRRRKVNSSSMV